MSEATTPDTTTPDTTGPENQAPDTGTGGPDLAAQIAALTAQVQTLTAAKAEADAQVEAARQAALTEAERLAEDRSKLEAEKAQMLDQARKDAAAKLGVFDKALPLLPEGDPRTPEGAKMLADWAKANPEFVRQQTPPPKTFDAPPKSALAQILSGEKKHPYLSAESARAMLSRSEHN